MPTKMVDGVVIPLIPEEEQKLTEENAAYTAEQKDYADNHKYKDDRKRAYGAVEDQLDMQYWDKVNGTTTWEDHVATVKAKYPKP